MRENTLFWFRTRNDLPKTMTFPPYNDASTRYSKRDLSDSIQTVYLPGCWFCFGCFDWLLPVAHHRHNQSAATLAPTVTNVTGNNDTHHVPDIWQNFLTPGAIWVMDHSHYPNECQDLKVHLVPKSDRGQWLNGDDLTSVVKLHFVLQKRRHIGNMFLFYLKSPRFIWETSTLK